MGNLITKKKSKSTNKQTEHPKTTHEEQQVLVDHFAGWIKPNTTILKFYNRLSNNGKINDLDINQSMSGRGWTLLHMSCKAENIPITKALIAAGAYINAKLSAIPAYTPLDIALNQNNMPLVQLLILNGAISHDGISCYMESSDEKLKSYNEKLKNTTILENEKNIIMNEKNKIMTLREYLLNNSIKDFGNNDNQYQLFSTAYHNNDVHVTKILLETAKVNPNGSDWTSPIRTATKAGHLELVQLLVNHGAVMIEGYNPGDTISALARKLGHHQIADFIDQTQKARYQKIKEEADLQHKYNLFLFGLFSDQNSTLHTQLLRDVRNAMPKKMIEYEYIRKL